MQLMKKTLSDQIYDILKQEILTHQIPFGDVLVNRTLQERFNVSSTPIRDAINKLQADGLVLDISKTGAKVIDFNLKFASDINEILMFIIRTGILLTDKRGNRDKAIADLNKYIKLQEENIGTDKYFNYDYDFHKTFIDYSENARLKKLFKEHNVLQEVLVRSFYEYNSKKNQLKSIEDHKLMVQYFKDGNLEMTCKINENHYDMAEELFKSKYK